ncbi:MAG: helix-turn-helix transcriptional regulator [bacterium]
MKTLVQIGKQIKAARKAKKKTQADLADLTGLSDNYIALLERGHRSPSIETLDKISKALKEPISFFFIFTQEKRIELTKKQLLDKMIKKCSEHNADDIYLVLEVVDLIRNLKQTK